MVELPLTLPETLVPFAPSDERKLKVYGATAHLALIPSRRDREGYDRENQPAFQPSPAARIIDEESYWRSETLALTPNKFPFGRGQRILWMTQPARDPDLAFWRATLDWVERSDGTALLNNIGAAATIPRAHAHLINERLPFLSEVGERPVTTPPIAMPRACELVAKDISRCVLGVRGPVDDRAEALISLADVRRTDTWNVILTRDASWVVPRTLQTPRPYFATPMGAAEFWGRFCYVDEQQFEAATSQDLTRAWELTTAPAVG